MTSLPGTFRGRVGAHNRVRTDDLFLTKEVLCRLSYVGPRASRGSRRRDSNPEPAVYKTAALPIELRRQRTATKVPERPEMIGLGQRTVKRRRAGPRARPMGHRAAPWESKRALRGPRAPAARCLEHQDGAGNGGVERADDAPHRDPDEEVATPPDRGRQAAPLAAHDDRESAPEDPPAGRSAVRSHRHPRIRTPRTWRSVSAPGRSSTGQSRRCSVAPAEAFTAAGLERRLSLGREDDAVNAGGLGAPQQGPDVLGILQRVEDEDEGRLVALDRPGEDSSDRRRSGGPRPRRDALVPVEPGERRERSRPRLRRSGS